MRHIAPPTHPRLTLASKIGLRALATLFLGAAAALSACQAQTELPDDGPPIEVSTEDAFAFLQQALFTSESALSGGAVRFTVTERQVTSFLNLGSRLAEAAQGAGVELPDLDQLGGQQLLDQLKNVEGYEELEELARRLPGSEGGDGLQIPDLRLRLIEPQVYFKADGRIILRGHGQFLRWRQPVRIVVAPSAANGVIVLDFVEGRLGPAPLPEFLFDPLGELLVQAILAGQEYVEITEITVGHGTLTVAGRRGSAP